MFLYHQYVVSKQPKYLLECNRQRNQQNKTNILENFATLSEVIWNVSRKKFGLKFCL